MPNICDIDEIIRAVCRFCDNTTLARLARSSKGLQEPALDVLWKTLTSFANLLKLLPDGLVEWRSMEWIHPMPVVQHIIVPRDWKRFSFYAPRVRNWEQEDLSYINEHIVDHIAFGRLPGHILPRLTHMEVAGSNTSGIHLQTLMLCPSLQSITIWNDTPSSDTTRCMQSLFRTLADKSPQLKKLVVHWGDGREVTEKFKDGLADIYSAVSCLQDVHLLSPGCVSPRSFQLLAAMPQLTTLHLNLINVKDAHDICTSVCDPGKAFPSLQDIFFAGELDEFNKILRCFSEQRILSIGFSVREYPRAKALQTLFNTVATNFASTLRIIHFNVPKEEIDTNAANRHFAFAPDVYQHDMSLLRPLLKISGLAVVHLELAVPLQLTDADLKVVGSAWPKIEMLNLCADPYCERTRNVRPTATVRGLFALLEQCACLRRVGLYADYTLHMSSELVASAAVASTSVVELDAGRSWITQPPLVAALLSGVLPALSVFVWSGMADQDSWRELNGVQVSSWKQVFELLPVFRAARENERRLRSSSAGTDMNID